MSIKSLMATACGALLTVSAMSALAQDTQTKDRKTSCCTSACGMHASGKMRCSLTGKVMETCCCQPVDDEANDGANPDDAQQ